MFLACSMHVPQQLLLAVILMEQFFSRNKWRFKEVKCMKDLRGILLLRSNNLKHSGSGLLQFHVTYMCLLGWCYIIIH